MVFVLDWEFIDSEFTGPFVARFPTSQVKKWESATDYVLTVSHSLEGTPEIDVIISRSRNIMDVIVPDFFHLVDEVTDLRHLVELVSSICRGKLRGRVTRLRGRIVGCDTRLEVSDGDWLYYNTTDLLAFVLPGKVDEMIGFTSFPEDIAPLGPPAGDD